MKLILQENVAKLGKAGDLIESKPGYFRNYLEPRKLAVVATPGTLKKREEDLEAMRKKAETAHQASVDLAEKITAIATLKLSAKAGEGGRLYGKVTNKEIAQALSKELGTEIDKRTVKGADEINHLGAYPVQVKLLPDVAGQITVEVVSE
jgi:large subunit ribosomal protein L9